MVETLKKVERIVQAPLEPLGYSVVRVMLTGNYRRTLQIMIERLDEAPVQISDCERASRVISVHLDQADLIQSAYDLEVSSPGLDRPLVKLNDFIRFNGRDIVIKTHVPIAQRKTFQGALRDVSGEVIHIACQEDGGAEVIVEIPFSSVKSARLYVDFDNI